MGVSLKPDSILTISLLIDIFLKAFNPKFRIIVSKQNKQNKNKTKKHQNTENLIDWAPFTVLTQARLTISFQVICQNKDGLDGSFYTILYLSTRGRSWPAFRWKRKLFSNLYFHIVVERYSRTKRPFPPPAPSKYT